jgi:Uncharacterized conserved protein
MYRIDNATAVTPIPTPGAVGPNPNYFFSKGNPGLGIPATIVDDDWANAVQEEICNVITAAGITLSKTTRTQLRDAIYSLAGQKYVHTQGSANVTWSITHNLNNINHQVVARNASNVKIEPDSTTFGANTTTLVFNEAVDGVAVIN